MLAQISRRVCPYLPTTLVQLSGLCSFCVHEPQSIKQALSDTSPVCLPAVSCTLQSVPNLDGCCINNPSGHFLQTQFWDTSPPLGGGRTWTIHGLWPDFCDGGFDQYCDSHRSHSAEAITRILSNASTPEILSHSGVTHPGLLEFMTEHWLSLDSRNSNLWAHEWNKHGTCISTLEPQCYKKDGLQSGSHQEARDEDVLDYFTHAALLYNTLPTFDFLERHGIVPSHDVTYELEHLQRAIRDSSHGNEVTFRCRHGNELSEIWYSFHVRGSMRNAMELWWDGNQQWNTWVPADPTGQIINCPASRIRYLPKQGHSAPSGPTKTYTATATATATHTSAPSAKPFTGKGRLMIRVISDDSGIHRHDHHQQSLLHQDVSQGDASGKTLTEPLPDTYTGCLIRKGTWFHARSTTSCATFTAHDDVKAGSERLSMTDEDDDYHLFTLASRYAPCSFVEVPTDLEKTAANTGSMYFACANDLPFQTIFSNDASPDGSQEENSKRLTLGAQHKHQFFAEGVPNKNEQLKLWTDDGLGSRKVKVEIFWEEIDSASSLV